MTFCLSKKTEFAAASEAFIQTIIGSLEHINASLGSRNISLADFQIGATSYDFLVKNGHLSLSSRLYSVEWHHESPQSCKILKLFLSTLDERILLVLLLHGIIPGKLGIVSGEEEHFVQVQQHPAKLLVESYWLHRSQFTSEVFAKENMSSRAKEKVRILQGSP